MKPFILFHNRFINTAIIISFACIGNIPVQASGFKNQPASLTKISVQEWQQMLKEARTAQRQVTWKVKITEVSFFGGFYVKGHLLDSSSAKIHMTWAAENTPTGANRDILAAGETVTVCGVIEGVTTEKELIIHVIEFRRQ